MYKRQLRGTVKETIMQVSRSKKWLSKPAVDEDGKPILQANGKPCLLYTSHLENTPFL